MKDMEPQPAAWIDRAPHKVRASRELIASPAEVWAALADHARWPEWFGALDRAEATGGEAVGSTRSVWVKKWRIDEEFIVWDVEKSFGFTVTAADGPIGWLADSLNERVDIQVLSPDRVRITYLQGWQPRNKVAARLLKLAAKNTQKSLRDALATLGPHIEADRSGS